MSLVPNLEMMKLARSGLSCVPLEQLAGPRVSAPPYGAQLRGRVSNARRGLQSSPRARDCVLRIPLPPARVLFPIQPGGLLPASRPAHQSPRTSPPPPRVLHRPPRAAPHLPPPPP